MTEQPLNNPEAGQNASPRKEPEAVILKTVDILVEVSRDKLEAWITLKPVTDNPVLAPGQIGEALNAHGIVFGIIDEVLREPESALEFNKRIPVARGQASTAGRNGEIKFLVDASGPVRVRKGQKLAEVIPPVNGAPGRDICGLGIPDDEPLPARIPELRNVEFAPENERSLVATIDGYLTLDDHALKVEPFFVLEKVVEDFEAWIRVNQRLHENDFGALELKAFLADNDIVHGIREDEIESIFARSRYGESILIAQGSRPRDGQDGELKYYFETEVRPQIDENGNVDFKSLNLIQNVRRDDKLVEILPPCEGAEGTTISGKNVPPRKGSTAALPSAKNAHPDPENPNVLISAIDGCVRLKGKTVEVEPVFTVKEDVDFSTGNIDFLGSVRVGKNVRSGFRIKAQGDVEIGGVVEDAVIEAQGNVLVKLGIIGRGKGEIIAGGEVKVLFCDGQNISADGNVSLGDYAMNSLITSGGTVNAVEKSGLIAGGETFASLGLEVKTLGNRNYVPTRVIAGMDKKLRDETLKLQKRTADLDEKINRMSTAVRKFAMIQLLKRRATREQEMQVTMLRKLIHEKQKDKEQVAAEISELNIRATESIDAAVRVLDTAYPGVTVTMRDKSIKLIDPMKALLFRYRGNDLLMLPLDEDENQPAPSAPENNNE